MRHRRKYAAVAALVAASLSACGTAAPAGQAVDTTPTVPTSDTPGPARPGPARPGPATVPPDDPQQTDGDGWRLLADQAGKRDSWQVHIARDGVEYETLWASLELAGDQPNVDFQQELVIHFGAVYSGSCPEIRLDGIEFRDDSISADVVQLGGMRACTADANARSYLVAIPIDRLPTAPFTVQPTSTPCGGCLPLAYRFWHWPSPPCTMARSR